MVVSEEEEREYWEEKAKKNALPESRVVRGILRQRGGTSAVQRVYPLLFESARMLIVYEL
jgi:hypothetical protein